MAAVKSYENALLKKKLRVPFFFATCNTLAENYDLEHNLTGAKNVL